jgi:inorganic pyrophosphatase
MTTSRKRKRSGKERASQISTITVVIETPRGSRNKLKYDFDQRAYKLSKVLPEGMMFPYDFGFVPATKAEDGDPVDVLVLTDEPLFPGCLVDTILVGVIELKQRENGKSNRNDRVIAVAQASASYSDIKRLDDLNPTVLKQIEAFFVNYQKVRDIKVTILGRSGPREAFELLQRSGYDGSNSAASESK